MIKSIATALTIAALATTAQAREYVPMPKGWVGGGVLEVFGPRYERWNASGKGMAIISDHLRTNQCISACTLALSLDHVCVGSDMKFGFHGPSANIMAFLPVPGVHGMDTDRRDTINRELAATYDKGAPGLGQWFLDNAAHRVGFDIAWMSGRDLHERYGVRLCPESKKKGY